MSRTPVLRALPCAEQLEPHEPVHPVPAGETSRHVVPVFPHAPHQVAGHADVQRAVALAGEDVDGGLRVAHGVFLGSGPLPAQGQAARG